MLLVRCTASLLKSLRVVPHGEAAAQDTTTLGEWYANTIAVGRQRYVLFLNAASRAVLLVEASPRPTLLDRFREHLAAFLYTLGVSEEAIRREVEAAREVTMARTADRSVVGSLVQIGKDLKVMRRVHDLHEGLPTDGFEIDLAFLIQHPLGNFVPADVVRERFGIPRAGEFAFADPPPGTIRVRRAHGDDWEFSFPHLKPAAMETIYEALERYRAGSVRIALLTLERVVRESPECLAAINGLANILAENGRSAASMTLWRHAVAMGRSALPADFQVGRDRLPWGVLDNRSYLRACTGLALSLERSGELEEAEALYQDLLSLNPDDNQGIRQLLVDLRLKRSNDAGVIELCDRYRGDTTESVLFGRVLALFRLGRVDEATGALAEAVSTLPIVAEEIARAHHLPPPELDPDHVMLGGRDQAFHYWNRAGGAWARTPGAIEFVASFLADDPRTAEAKPPTGFDNVIPLRPALALDPPAGEFLSDEQVNAIVEKMRLLLGARFPSIVGHVDGRDVADAIRYRQLGDRLYQAREALGLTPADVATKLKVPRYRVEATEMQASNSFHVGIFWRYCEFLELRDFAIRWIAANEKTARKMGLDPPA